MNEVLMVELFIISFIVIFLLLRLHISIARKRGILAPDVHKLGQPQIPTMGGVVFFSLIPIYLSLIYVIGEVTHRRVPIFNEILAIIATITIAGLIGLIDDLHDLGLKKVPLTIVCVIPILVLRAYYPRLIIPFIGPIRITIVYPLLLIIAFPVVINAINMIDTHNGVMLSAVMSILTPLLIWALIKRDVISATYIVIALGATLAFFVWNKYPAKVFLGNVGSYFMGGLLIMLIVISKLEYIALVAMFPIILHAFYLLTSIKGLMTREKIGEKIGRPVLIKDAVIYPSLDPKAPLVLDRIILIANGPMTEKELIKKFYTIFAFSAILALLTGFLLP